MHQSIKDYCRIQPELKLEYCERIYCGVLPGQPISFNPMTDEITYADDARETIEQVIVTGFTYEGKGFTIRGNIKPIMLQQHTYIDGELYDVYDDNGELCEAIYAAIGPCNRDVVDII